MFEDEIGVHRRAQRSNCRTQYRRRSRDVRSACLSSNTGIMAVDVETVRPKKVPLAKMAAIRAATAGLLVMMSMVIVRRVGVQ